MKKTRQRRRLGVYAGSFDPLTIGHLWMIEQGAQLFDEFIVAIGVNPDKRYSFPLEERLAMVRECTASLPNHRVASFSNLYLIDYAQSVGATHILRGIRSTGDYEFERNMRNINGDLDGRICSVFLMPPRDIAEISSSMVKGLIGPNGWRKIVRNYVPAPVYQRLLKLHRMNALAQDRWFRLWRAATGKDAPGGSFEEITRLYSEPHRFYHNHRHIADCLAEFDRLRPLARSPEAVELAIWFHDAIYDPKAGDNEERSAELARSWLAGNGTDPRLVVGVAQLVLATKAHDASLHPDAPLLVDVDLSILGQPESRFWEYEAQIRREYDWVPPELYRSKRAEVLEGFLGRPRIYQPPDFRTRLEAAARANLAASIRKLRSAAA